MLLRVSLCSLLWQSDRVNSLLCYASVAVDSSLAPCLCVCASTCENVFVRSVLEMLCQALLCRQGV